MAMSDEHLEYDIKQKLLRNDKISSQRIAVTASQGVVTLRGEVQSYRRKLAAQKIVSDDRLVAEVRNEIVVLPDLKSDSALAASVNNRLDIATDLANESICIAANSGIVSLTGYVKTEQEKLRVVDIAAAVDGVRKVVSFLVINPDEVAANQFLLSQSYRFDCERNWNARTGCSTGCFQ